MKHNSDDLDFFFNDELKDGNALATIFSNDDATAFKDGKAFDSIYEADNDEAGFFEVLTESATLVASELSRHASERIADLLKRTVPRLRRYVPDTRHQHAAAISKRKQKREQGRKQTAHKDRAHQGKSGQRAACVCLSNLRVYLR